MARRNRECYLCGTGYKYCPTCSEDKIKPTWMAEFHSEDCVKIFAICTDFNIGKMSKEEARKALDACNLSNKLNFRSCIQRDIDIIFADENNAAKKNNAAPHEVVVEKENK